MIFRFGLQSLCCWSIIFSPPVLAEDFQKLPEFGDVVLKPQMRVDPLDKNIYSIETKSILPYLENIVMVDSMRDYEKLPYIIGFDRQVTLGSADNFAYVMGINPNDNLSAFSIIKSGIMFVNPETKEKLGLQTFVVGNAEMNNFAVPQVLLITYAIEYIYAGARLIPHVGLDLPAVLPARLPSKPMRGYVLYVRNDTVGAGQYSIAALSLGRRDGLALGDLLELRDADRQTQDLYTKKNVSIKPTKFGEILIYKCMEKVSLGFILNASRPVLVNDQVVDKVQES